MSRSLISEKLVVIFFLGLLLPVAAAGQNPKKDFTIMPLALRM
jgi:hypothetical protein